MDELDERIGVLHQCGFVDETGARDLEKIAEILVKECGVSRESEVLGTLVTHVAAAIKRVRDGEKVDPLSPEIVAEVKASPVHDEAERIQQLVIDAVTSELPQEEKDFVLVHVGGLLMSQANA